METTRAKFSSSLGVKIIIIFVLGLFLLIPTLFIDSMINDRVYHQRKAIRSILEPLGGELRIGGVFLAIPYTVQSTIDGNVTYQHKTEYSSPTTYNVEGHINTELLQRSNYSVPLLFSDFNVHGNFGNFLPKYTPSNRRYNLEDAHLVIHVQNRKNFKKAPVIQFYGDNSNSPIPIKYTQNDSNTASFKFKIPKKYITKNNFNFKTVLAMQGGKSIRITPLKSENFISITSSWTDPSFGGDWLPTKRNVSEEGFQATWDIPRFHVNNISDLSDRGDHLSIDFLQINDNYQKTTRSVKYAILFIFIPFLTLFLCEVLNKKVLHIVQYIMIAFANIIFFLLLLSLSEYLSFNVSYAISAFMVTALVSLYAGYCMHSKKMGRAIAIVQAAVYTYLFITLQLGTYSLLVGTIGLFTVLALAMYLTRNVNWYNPSEGNNNNNNN